MNLGKLGVWFFFDGTTSTEAAETAKRIEDFADTTVTPQMIDQAFQIVINAIKKG